MSDLNTGDPYDQWFHEDAIANSLAKFLEEEGWSIEQRPSARSRERGIDIVARQVNAALLIEVKGYPSQFYMDERKRGQTKPTQPSSQAHHWFSHALLKVMRMSSQYPGAQIAMAFPDMPRYRGLYAETRPKLDQISIQVYFICKNGEVLCNPEYAKNTRSKSNDEFNSVTGKYENLHGWLKLQTGQVIEISFEEVKAILGFLPNSAYRWPAWWANNETRGHAVWLKAGWKTKALNLDGRTVQFERI
jgi:Holliday junction resolvase-like predicted endonuclease